MGWVCVYREGDNMGGGRAREKYMRRGRVRGGGRGGKNVKYMTHDGVEILTSKWRETTG